MPCFPDGGYRRISPTTRLKSPLFSLPLPANLRHPGKNVFPPLHTTRPYLPVLQAKATPRRNPLHFAGRFHPQLAILSFCSIRPPLTKVRNYY